MAIAFDNATTGTGSGTTVNETHTVISNTNGLVLAGIYQGTDNSDHITGVTYNGAAMTRVNTTTGPNYRIFLYYLLAPPTGANTIAVSSNLSVFIQVFAASYTGVSQSGFPDNQTSSNGSGITTLTETLTTVANNCWLGGIFNNDASALTAGANTTLRHAGTAMAIADTNAVQSIGSHSLTVSWTGNANAQGCICSFAPAVAATSSVYPQIFSFN